MQAAAEASPETADADGPESLRILVCTPVYGDSVKRGYAHSVAQAMAFFAQAKSDVDKHVDITMVYSSLLVENRHMLVSRAFQFEATHMLFWDSDIKAPADCIVKLVNHHLPIVAINYAKKEPEARPTAFIDTDGYIGPCYTQKHHTGLQAVSSCGFGLMLIRMDVLQGMKTPLFQFTQEGPEGIKTGGEDVFFCHKARAAGFDIVIDHDLSKQCAHLGDWEYTVEMSDIAQAAKQQIYRGMPTSEPDGPL
jgi:hypothetical protein